MNRYDFLRDLDRKLRKLPKEERSNIRNYYLEYFEDSNKSDEEVIRELGSTSAIASQILADYAFNDENNTNRLGTKIWMIILAIFAAPIGLPIALAAFIVLIAIVFSLGAVILSIVAVAVALLFAGGITLVVGIALTINTPSTAAFYIGAGLFVIGLSYIIWHGIRSMMPSINHWIKNISNKILLKFNVIKNRKDD
ncbi:MAG: DUF1700 domain-containing protein [Clostridiaceae bacterium]|nr:DUF1700 domain-containing protein [Clostridiaceae bacterium]